MKSLFIAFTPYQCINATALALNNPEKESDLILMEWGKSDENLISNLNKVFKNIYVLPNRAILLKNKKFRRRMKYDWNVYKLKNKLKKQSYNMVYASSESMFYSQYFIKKIVRQNVKYYHFEDGSFEYSSHIGECKGMVNNVKRIVHGISLGFHCKLYEIAGQAEFVEKLYLLCPELRRKELINKETEKINQHLFHKALEILYPNVKSIEQGVIIALDSSERGEIIMNLNQRIYNLVQSEIGNVYLKYHPRELPENYYIKSESEINFIDSSLPLECVLKNFKGVLISNLSSVLHVVNFMNSNIDIICTAYLDNEIRDQSYIEMLKKLNIKMPRNEEELIHLLNSLNSDNGVKGDEK